MSDADETTSVAAESPSPRSSTESDDQSSAEVRRLVEIMCRLRRECPWDREQTHASLMPYLIEETAEVVEAVEDGSDEEMVEELGDVLLQVVFHSEIAAQRGAFTLADVARHVADKLIARHPYVYADQAVPTDPATSWEKRKRAEKHRRSALDGIPDQLSSLARAAKVVTRLRSHDVAVALPDQTIDAEAAGQAMLGLVARAQASHVDPDQALRDVVRQLEKRARAVELESGQYTNPHDISS